MTTPIKSREERGKLLALLQTYCSLEQSLWDIEWEITDRLEGLADPYDISDVIRQIRFDDYPEHVYKLLVDMGLVIEDPNEVSLVDSGVTYSRFLVENTSDKTDNLLDVKFKAEILDEDKL